MLVEPKARPVEEMKASLINQATAVRLVFGPEEVEYLGGSLEIDDPALLLHSECCYPGRNEAVLAEREAEFGMSGDIEKESSVPPRVNKLRPCWPAERNAAEYEGSCIEGKLLLTIVPFFADEGDGFELPEPELCEAEKWRRPVPGGQVRGGGLRSPSFNQPRQRLLPKVFQKSM